MPSVSSSFIYVLEYIMVILALVILLLETLFMFVNSNFRFFYICLLLSFSPVNISLLPFLWPLIQSEVKPFHVIHLKHIGIMLKTNIEEWPIIYRSVLYLF